MITLTGSAAARVSTADFPVDNVDQQTAASIQPAAQAALSGVARAYSELDAIDSRLDAVEVNVAGAGGIDGRLDALETLTGPGGSIDSRLDAVEANSLTNIGLGATRQSTGNFSVPSGATSAAQNIPLGSVAPVGGFSDPGFWNASEPEYLTAPQDGRYHISFSANSPAPVETISLLFRDVGGVGLSSTSVSAGERFGHYSGSVTLNMLATQSVFLRAKNTSGGPQDITGRMSMVRVR